MCMYEDEIPLQIWSNCKYTIYMTPSMSSSVIGKMQYRTDAGQFRCRTGQMQDRTDAGQVRSRTGHM